jgi:hypothetical protein
MEEIVQVEKMQKRIEKIKAELQLIGEMRPGSLNKQYTKCGRANCRCQDAKNPKRHGPYFQLSYVHHGKSTTQFIKSAHVNDVKRQLANYKKFRGLTSQWIDIALDLAKAKLKIDKESHT